MKQKSYAYVIEKADDGGFWAYLPDLPGCTTRGETMEEVEALLPEAVEMYLQYYRERGLSAPLPQSKVGNLPAA
jgi:predicted RNase H-like HicB family nuclease